MAKFAAKYANYSHGVRTGRSMVLADGQRQEITKHLQAKFRRGVLSETEENVAIAGLNHAGLPIDRDTEEHFSPRSRISGFDSLIAQEFHGWTDEEREIVEDVLRKSQLNGVEFLELSPQAVGKPWASYDNLSDPQAIADLTRLTGVPVEVVIAYEKQNAFRLDVLEALSNLNSEEPDDEPVLIQA